jgi:hypothetical protein
MAKKKTDAALNDAIEKLEHIESEVNESLTEEITEETEEVLDTESVEVAPTVESIDLVEAINDTLNEELEKAQELEKIKAEEDLKAESENIVTVIEPIIPEPAYVVNGDMKVESFNHKSVTINGKTYPIDRAQHKALVAGDFSILTNLKNN